MAVAAAWLWTLLAACTFCTSTRRGLFPSHCKPWPVEWLLSGLQMLQSLSDFCEPPSRCLMTVLK